MYTFRGNRNSLQPRGPVMSAVSASPEVRQPSRLLDLVRQRAVEWFGRVEPAERHVQWVRRFILFHGKRHPRDLRLGEVRLFLEHLAQSEKDPLRSIEQA